MKAQKAAIDTPEAADRFNRVLNDTVSALEESGIQYLFIGGIASGGLGRPRTTHDIDVFVRPEDAEASLRALAKHGFRIERTDPNWLFKGLKDNVLVDVIFKSKGEIYLDPEMYHRKIITEFHGRRLRSVAPEDLILIKALAHSEATPGHWHDALAVLTHTPIDWNYLVSRARRAPRRLLSLLLYAQSVDILVPKKVIDQLYSVIFGDQPPVAVRPEPESVSPTHTVHVLSPAPARQDENAAARLRERLAADPQISELDIQIEVAEGKLLLRGEVISVERRKRIGDLAKQLFPQLDIENQIRVSELQESGEIEDVG